jgi:hypothetical protein
MVLRGGVVGKITYASPRLHLPQDDDEDAAAADLAAPEFSDARPQLQSAQGSRPAQSSVAVLLADILGGGARKLLASANKLSSSIQSSSFARLS